MQMAKYVFCGNRFNVLEEMFNLQLQVETVFSVAGSYLEKEMIARRCDHISVDNKAALIRGLREADFDVFISNGCPFILPESVLRLSHKKFINIHPSLLPDLRGADPVVGALLFGRDSGATCHIMNALIDDGEIIAQVKIPNTADLDSGLLYQLSFMAEKEAFRLAYHRNFNPCMDNVKRVGDIYYSFNDSDRLIDFSQKGEDIINTIKAFSTKSKGAYFKIGEETYTVFDAIEVNNPYLVREIDHYVENEVVFNYEGRLLIRKGSIFLKLQQIQGNLEKIEKGAVLQ